jgi:hypothetical protein
VGRARGAARGPLRHLFRRRKLAPLLWNETNAAAAKKALSCVPVSAAVLFLNHIAAVACASAVSCEW